MNMSEEEDTLVKWLRRRFKEKVTRRGVPGSLVLQQSSELGSNVVARE